MAERASIHVDGLDATQEVIGARRERLENLRPGLGLVADALEAHVQRNFDTEGESTGAGWASLAPSTVLARRNRWGYYRAEPTRGVGAEGPILQWTRRLRRSFRQGGDGHVRQIDGSGLEWGSDLDYAAYHDDTDQYGGARGIIRFRDEGQERDVTTRPLEMYLRGANVSQIRTLMERRLG